MIVGHFIQGFINPGDCGINILDKVTLSAWENMSEGFQRASSMIHITILHEKITGKFHFADVDLFIL